MRGRKQRGFLGAAFYKLFLNSDNLNQRREPDLILAKFNSGDKINRNRQYAAATGQLVLPLGGCRWLWVGNASTFLSDGDEYGVHLIFLPPLPHRLSVIGCRPPRRCPERGNRSVPPFTSPAFRLAESIRQDRPSDSPPPFHFCQVYIRPNYFSLGCQSCFLDRPDHP